MKDKKRIEILLKAIERIYNKNTGIQKLMYKSMIDVCKEEGVSPKQVFPILLLSTAVFVVMGYPNIFFLCVKEKSL